MVSAELDLAASSNDTLAFTYHEKEQNLSVRPAGVSIYYCVGSERGGMRARHDTFTGSMKTFYVKNNKNRHLRHKSHLVRLKRD